MSGLDAVRSCSVPASNPVLPVSSSYRPELIINTRLGSSEDYSPVETDTPIAMMQLQSSNRGQEHILLVLNVAGAVFVHRLPLHGSHPPSKRSKMANECAIGRVLFSSPTLAAHPPVSLKNLLAVVPGASLLALANPMPNSKSTSFAVSSRLPGIWPLVFTLEGQACSSQTLAVPGSWDVLTAIRALPCGRTSCSSLSLRNCAGGEGNNAARVFRSSMPAVADGQLWVWGDAAGVIWVGAVGVEGQKIGDCGAEISQIEFLNNQTIVLNAHGGITVLANDTRGMIQVTRLNPPIRMPCELCSIGNRLLLSMMGALWYSEPVDELLSARQLRSTQVAISGEVAKLCMVPGNDAVASTHCLDCTKLSCAVVGIGVRVLMRDGKVLLVSPSSGCGSLQALRSGEHLQSRIMHSLKHIGHIIALHGTSHPHALTEAVSKLKTQMKSSGADGSKQLETVCKASAVIRRLNATGPMECSLQVVWPQRLLVRLKAPRELLVEATDYAQLTICFVSLDPRTTWFNSVTVPLISMGRVSSGIWKTEIDIDRVDEPRIQCSALLCPVLGSAGGQISMGTMHLSTKVFDLFDFAAAVVGAPVKEVPAPRRICWKINLADASDFELCTIVPAQLLLSPTTAAGRLPSGVQVFVELAAESECQVLIISSENVPSLAAVRAMLITRICDVNPSFIQDSKGLCTEKLNTALLELQALVERLQVYHKHNTQLTPQAFAAMTQVQPVLHGCYKMLRED